MKWKANEVRHVVLFVPAKNESFYLRVSNKLYASRITTKMMWSVCIGKAKGRKAVSSAVLFQIWVLVGMLFGGQAKLQHSEQRPVELAPYRD